MKRRHGILPSPKKTTKAASGGDDGDDDPLARTGRFCGGLVKDLRRLRKRYKSDFTDSVRMQVITTAIFMFFAAIAPVITFGGLLGKKTSKSIGLAEMVVATSFGGMFFALFAGQPLMLIGPTGPLLVFEEVIYNFCSTQGVEYYPFRFWTGMWVFVFLFIVVATDLSLLIKKFTRFTEEVFAALIGFIFIYEALKSIFTAFSDHPLRAKYCAADVCVVESNQNSTLAEDVAVCLSNWTSPTSGTNSTGKNSRSVQTIAAGQPNTALLYLILVIGTFCLAYALRILRHSRYLSKEIRRTMSDFGILITIIISVLIAHYVFGSADSETVAAPDGFMTTNSTRLWVLKPMEGLGVVWVFAAIVPALLVAFLIFVETQVTALIVGSPDHKLKKGPGFHWNLLLVSFLVIVCSVLGLPWLCGTPVPSLSHTMSLLVYGKSYAPGEKPKVVGAVEQRVSNILIHCLIALTLSPPVTLLLRQVPIAVLFGVFLYLGVLSVLRLQFTHRTILMLVPPKHHPDSSLYVQRVRTLRMHTYTFIQLICLGILIIFKMTPAALVFPIMILLMVPLRNYGVSRYFTSVELEALDPHDDEEFIIEGDYDSLEDFDAER